MSFILDALRKSESQRQRHDGPGFAAVHSGSSERVMPFWVPLLGGLLLINALVLAVLLWPSSKKELALPAPVGTESVTVSTPSPEPLEKRQRVVRSLAREASAVEPPIQQSATGEPASQAAAAPEPQAGGSVTFMPEDQMDAYLGLDDSTRATRAGGSVTHVIANPNADPEYLRDLTDLRLNGEINLPELNLDVLSWTAEPGSRWIFVNMKKYGEGDTLREGPTVEEITENGAVLIFNGQRFALRPD